MSHKNNSAKFAFFYVLSLVALGFMAISVGMIIFQIINKELADIINEYRTRFDDEQLKFAISSLIITTPIYYLISKQIHKSLYKGDLDENSGIRKWLTYLILLVAAIVMIVNVINTLNGFLGGELTLNSILKTVTVLGISGIIFAFYFYDIKRDNLEGRKDKKINIFSYASLAVVLLVFISAWFFVESPSYARDKKIDSEIIGDINNLRNTVDAYYAEHQRLPEDLNFSERIWKDPRTNQEYEYEVISENEYKICADFATSNLEKEAYQEWRDPVGIDFHDKGYKCFNRKVTNKEPRPWDVNSREVIIK